MKNVQKGQMIAIQVGEAILRIICFLEQIAKQSPKKTWSKQISLSPALSNSLGLTKTFGTESIEEIERISLLHLNFGLKSSTMRRLFCVFSGQLSNSQLRSLRINKHLGLG